MTKFKDIVLNISIFFLLIGCIGVRFILWTGQTIHNIFKKR